MYNGKSTENQSYIIQHLNDIFKKEQCSLIYKPTTANLLFCQRKKNVSWKKYLYNHLYTLSDLIGSFKHQHSLYLAVVSWSSVLLSIIIIRHNNLTSNLLVHKALINKWKECPYLTMNVLSYNIIINLLVPNLTSPEHQKEFLSFKRHIIKVEWWWLLSVIN